MESNEKKEQNDMKFMIPIIVVLILVIVILSVVLIKNKKNTEDTAQIVETESEVSETESETETEEVLTSTIETEMEEQNTSTTQAVNTAQAADSTQNATTATGATMQFEDVSETVTAKEQVNLRDKPSQGTDSTVMLTLVNGDTATRTGVNSSNGWSRVEYNGTTYYAVSNYLTTDLSYKSTTEEGAGSGDGLKTKFTDTNEQVTAKIQVNLRALPSVTNPDATVLGVLYSGETVTRTGVNEEYGWSRVECNGQVMYCISSYVTVVQ